MPLACGIEIHDLENNKAAESLLREACCQAVSFLSNWNLSLPKCQVYITKRWQTIFFQASPLLWRVFYKVGLSLLPRRRKLLDKLWHRSAGWCQRYGNQCLIAPKPLSLFQGMNLEHSPLYQKMSAKEKFCNTLVHELTHAFTAHLKLPLWFNEGFALLGAEQALGYGAVKTETLELLKTPRQTTNYFRLPNLAGEDFFYHYAKGYWLTRYLQEEHEEVLEQLLKKRQSYSSTNKYVQKLFNNQSSDKVLYTYFKASQNSNSSTLQQGVATP
jgi:hypothetical protein